MKEPVTPLNARVSRAVGAGLLGLGITAAIQLSSVPLFVATIGLRTYGAWLVLTAIPTYLALSDLGLVGAASTEAIRRRTAGDERGAQNALSAAWLVISAISVVVAAGTALVLTTFDLRHPLGLESLPSATFRDSALLVMLYSLLMVQCSVVEGIFRSAGRYAFGLSCFHLIRLFEFAASGVAATVSHQLIYVATAFLGARLVGTCLYVLAMSRLVGQPRRSGTSDMLAAARKLCRPGIGFMAFPLGNAMSSQALVWLVSGAMGPTAVVTLTAVRIPANFIRQLVDASNNAVLPRLTAALMEGQAKRDEFIRGRRLMETTLIVNAAVTGFIVGALVGFGPMIIHRWTLGRIDVSRALLAAMLLTVFVDLFWLTPGLLLIAQNTHHWLGVAYVVGCLATILTAWLLISPVGLIIVPLALLATDITCIPVAWAGWREGRAPPDPSRNRERVLGANHA